eukprot:TRINITY_DN10277_c0_g1_i1.p4 TRINITY_DN10277_c0_g1~~TRINITY_DN10277_c0_g1_i1.p4  ORF type:complete len:107 (+),score=33.85 TRINITY_DN10277_c0_g1_i1:291-611(+)
MREHTMVRLIKGALRKKGSEEKDRKSEAKWRNDLARRVLQRRLDWASRGVLDGTLLDRQAACIAARGHLPTARYAPSLFRTPRAPALAEGGLHPLRLPAPQPDPRR